MDGLTSVDAGKLQIKEDDTLFKNVMVVRNGDVLLRLK